MDCLLPMTEITALRAKILEMREQAMTAEQDVRESVKKEFKEVIQSMFGAHSHLRTRFDEFRFVSSLSTLQQQMHIVVFGGHVKEPAVM